jgi:hypothetical protein
MESRVFENRVRRGIFGRKREEVTGGWRKSHNGELPNLYSPNIIRITRSRRMRGWEDNIEMDLRDVQWGGGDWINPP